MLRFVVVFESELDLERLKFSCCADEAFVDSTSCTHETKDEYAKPETPVKGLLGRIFEIRFPWVMHVGQIMEEESEIEEVANCGADRSSKAGVALTTIESEQTLYKRCDSGDPSSGVWHAEILSAERSPNASDSCPR